MTLSWGTVKRGLSRLSFVCGLSFGVYLILTPVLGSLTAFDGLRWTGIGVLWILSVLWQYSRIDW